LFDSQNNGLLRLNKVPFSFVCPDCGLITQTLRKEMVWFLPSSVGVIRKNLKGVIDAIEDIVVMVPSTFCQKGWCRRLVMLIPSASEEVVAVSISDFDLAQLLQEHVLPAQFFANVS